MFFISFLSCLLTPLLSCLLTCFVYSFFKLIWLLQIFLFIKYQLKVPKFRSAFLITVALTELKTYKYNVNQLIIDF